MNFIINIFNQSYRTIFSDKLGKKLYEIVRQALLLSTQQNHLIVNRTV